MINSTSSKNMRTAVILPASLLLTYFFNYFLRNGNYYFRKSLCKDFHKNIIGVHLPSFERLALLVPLCTYSRSLFRYDRSIRLPNDNCCVPKTQVISLLCIMTQLLYIFQICAFSLLLRLMGIMNKLVKHKKERKYRYEYKYP